MAPWYSSQVIIEASSTLWDAATNGATTPWTLFIRTTERAIDVSMPYAEALTAPAKTFQPLDNAIAPLSALAGAEVARYVVAMFLCVAIAPLYGRLRAPAFMKHIVGAALGIALAQWIFGPAWVAALAMAGGQYVVLVLFSAIPALRSLLPLASFTWCLGFMTATHLYRLHVDYLGWSLDMSGVLMLLTIKMTSLGYNLFDGLPKQRALYKAELDKAQTAAAAAAAASKDGKPPRKSGVVRTYEERTASAVTSVPDPLSFLGYVFFFPTLLAGPAVEYRVYQAAVAGKSPRATWRVYLQALLGGIVCLGLTQVMGGIWKAEDVRQPGVHSILPPHILAAGVPSFAAARWFYAFCISKRVKYYFAWLIAEAAALGAGMGWSEEHKDWRNARNIDVWRFETAPTLADGTKAWNTGTQAWLERCAYKRLPRSLQLVGTYMLSAFWHGFYPGYYFTFGSAALLQSAEKALSAKVAPRLPGAFVAVTSRVLTQITLNYAVLPFQALAWDAGIDAWNAVGWAGHVAAVAVLLLTSFIRAPRKKTHAE